MLRRRPVMRAAARTAVVAGTATAVSGRVQRRQARRFGGPMGASEQQQEAQPAPQAAPAPAAPTATPVEQLQQLAALRDQGVVTDAEFETEKAKILAG
ncbi:MAG: SHOCT domain-containing protein [Candidatus Microthrix sp.]|uniref:SHOCT domain-containing protein n=2 Tax=Candidatus Neomicrothrix TaxID=41949 RepID=A0A936NC17_9ACTN|nr:SHOCT domain-containing protein [uncultured Candidatus Microthrix sp.]MBK6437642.1 SHOCT domain-containing protein [Candidatus Microthrix sp.]MBK9297513.1 SHOCT domain-containing protein [Candidatus Microthrix subdominans]MBK6970065.1 SHOCT domain-containing protein [Candidatus Microthrix sp.]MBK7167556.1 SHOCT domain-containing protein [Candidatus Microthrix sp.]MBK9561361.1 SHOCT domain-containing protein [Candidatus Microthrix sp.]